jgi:hypothetical protein
VGRSHSVCSSADVTQDLFVQLQRSHYREQSEDGRMVESVTWLGDKLKLAGLQEVTLTKGWRTW